MSLRGGWLVPTARFFVPWAYQGHNIEDPLTDGHQEHAMATNFRILNPVPHCSYQIE